LCSLRFTVFADGPASSLCVNPLTPRPALTLPMHAGPHRRRPRSRLPRDLGQAGARRRGGGAQGRCQGGAGGARRGGAGGAVRGRRRGTGPQGEGCQRGSARPRACSLCPAHTRRRQQRPCVRRASHPLSLCCAARSAWSRA
jgi:hypothetical protein